MTVLIDIIQYLGKKVVKNVTKTVWYVRIMHRVLSVINKYRGMLLIIVYVIKNILFKIISVINVRNNVCFVEIPMTIV